jgi:hydrogenase maturation protease
VKRLVIGIGHPDRGDDAAGRLVVERLTTDRTQLRSDCGDLIELWAGEDDVVVVDAMRSGRPGGTVTRLDAAATHLEAGQFSSSHSFGLAETVELARALGRLPARLLIYGIEGADFAVGSNPTIEVEAAAVKLAAEIEAGSS